MKSKDEDSEFERWLRETYADLVTYHPERGTVSFEKMGVYGEVELEKLKNVKLPRAGEPWPSWKRGDEE